MIIVCEKDLDIERAVQKKIMEMKRMLQREYFYAKMQVYKPNKIVKIDEQ